MARICSICSHADRLEIDRLILRGDSIAGISRNFAVSEDSLARHRDKHLGEDVSDVIGTMRAAREEALAKIRSEELETVKAEIVTEAKEGLAARLELCKDHFGQLRVLRERAALALEKAEGSENHKIALQAIRELRELVRLWGELEGKISNQPQINLQQVSIYHSPQWREVGAMLAEVLNDYPDLRGEIAARLKAMVKAAEAGGQDGA